MSVYYGECSLKLSYCMKFFMQICFLTEIVKAHGNDKDWYIFDSLTSWNRYTDIESCHLWSLLKVQGSSVLKLGWKDALKIKYFPELIFLKRWYSYVHVCLHWLNECLQVNRMYFTSFWSYRKLVIKAK